MKKSTLTSGAMLAALLFAGANTSFAQTVAGTRSTAASSTPSKMHRMHWTLSDSALSELATKLGLNADTLAAEIKSGKSIQQALKDHGITEAQIKTAFGDVKPKDLKNFNLSDAQITALAAKLNVNAATIKQEIADGKTIKEIIAASGLTHADLQKIFGNRKGGNGDKMMMHGKKSFINSAPEMLQAEANVLNMTVDALKQSIQNGQTPEQIAISHGTTAAAYHASLANALQTLITNGTITGKKVDFYTSFIKKLTKV